METRCPGMDLSNCGTEGSPLRSLSRERVLSTMSHLIGFVLIWNHSMLPLLNYSVMLVVIYCSVI